MPISCVRWVTTYRHHAVNREVLRRDLIQIDVLIPRQLTPGDRKVLGNQVSAEGQPTAVERRDLDAWDSTHTFQDVQQPLHVVLAGVLQLGGSDERTNPDGQDVAIIDADVHIRHACKAREEQRAPGQGGRPPAPPRRRRARREATGARAGGRGALTGRHAARERGARELQHRRQPDGHAGRDGCERGGDEHTQIDRDARDPGNLGRHRGAQRLDHEPGQPCAERRTGGRQDERVEEQHACQIPATRRGQPGCGARGRGGWRGRASGSPG